MTTPSEKVTSAHLPSSRTPWKFVRGAACLMFALGLLGSIGALITQQAAAAESWFLLEFADSKPPCLEIPEGSRCIGTQPRATVFEMRDGERIEMPAEAPLPPAWAAWEQLWVYTPAIAGSRDSRAIELAATPMGARLLIVDGEYQYLQSVPLARWTALERRNQPKLWVRVSTYSP